MRAAVILTVDYHHKPKNKQKKRQNSKDTVLLTEVLWHHAWHTEQLSDGVDVTVYGDQRLVHVAEWIEGFGTWWSRHVHLRRGRW